MARKRLDHESNEEVKVTLKFTEDEKKLLLGVAERFPSSSGPKGPSVAQAVVYLVRLAFQCLSHHYEAEPLEPRKIGPKALASMLERENASVVSLRGLQKPRIKDIREDGTYTWDTDEKY